MIKLNNNNFAKLKTGKTQTIRLGIKQLTLGKDKIVNIDTDEHVECLITELRLTLFEWLGRDEARNDGFDSLPALKKELVNIYGGMKDDDLLTVIKFEIIS